MDFDHDPDMAERALEQYRTVAGIDAEKNDSERAAPEPLFQPMPAPAPFPIEALGPLREVVEAATEIAQAPIEIAAQTALATASLVTQAHANVRKLGSGWAPLSLYAITIAVSGERKGATDRLLMRGVREAEAVADDEYAVALKLYKKAHKLWQKRFDAATAAATDIMKPDRQRKGEEALEALEDEPEAPRLPILLASDPTPEGLWKLFHAGGPSLGLFNEEAGTFLGGHGMSQEHQLKTMSFFSKAWNADPLDRIRAGDGAAVLRGRRLAAHLMVQPAIVAPLISNPIAQKQGFLPRFLICHPTSRIGSRFIDPNAPDRSDAQAALSTFAADCRRLLRAAKPWAAEGSHELLPPVLELSAAARLHLIDFYNSVEGQSGPGERLDTHGGFASKIAEQAARIAGVLTVFADSGATEVDAQNMENATRLASYYLEEIIRIMESAQANPDLVATEHVRVWLVERWPVLAHSKNRNPNFILPSDLVQYGPRGAGVRDSDTAKARLECLAAHDWLIPAHSERIDGRVRRSAWQIVNPEVGSV